MSEIAPSERNSEETVNMLKQVEVCRDLLRHLYKLFNLNPHIEVQQSFSFGNRFWKQCRLGARKGQQHHLNILAGVCDSIELWKCLCPTDSFTPLAAGKCAEEGEYLMVIWIHSLIKAGTGCKTHGSSVSSCSDVRLYACGCNLLVLSVLRFVCFYVFSCAWDIVEDFKVHCGCNSAIKVNSGDSLLKRAPFWPLKCASLFPHNGSIV